MRAAYFRRPSTLYLGIPTAMGRQELGKGSPCPAECPLSAEVGCFLPLAAGFVCASAAVPCDPPGSFLILGGKKEVKIQTVSQPWLPQTRAS